MPTPSTQVRVSLEHWKEIRLLKIAWGCTKLDQVVERLLQPHRLDKIKALDIKFEEDPK